MILPYLSVKISEPVAVSWLPVENTRPLDFIAHDRKQHEHQHVCQVPFAPGSHAGDTRGKWTGAHAMGMLCS